MAVLGRRPAAKKALRIARGGQYRFRAYSMLVRRHLFASVRGGDRVPRGAQPDRHFEKVPGRRGQGGGALGRRLGRLGPEDGEGRAMIERFHQRARLNLGPVEIRQGGCGKLT